MFNRGQPRIGGVSAPEPFMRCGSIWPTLASWRVPGSQIPIG